MGTVTQHREVSDRVNTGACNLSLALFAHLCELRKKTLMLRGHVKIQNEAIEFVMYICN